MADDYIDILFDGPPSHESGRFVEVENSEQESIDFGKWIDRGDGYWALRIPHPKVHYKKGWYEAIDAAAEAKAEGAPTALPYWDTVMNTLQAKEKAIRRLAKRGG